MRLVAVDAITPSAAQMRARNADQMTVTIHTAVRDDSPMSLLGQGFSLSLLFDLVDPTGPDSEEIFQNEA